MHPLPRPVPPTAKTFVETPGSWYVEDMTPLQCWPHTPNLQVYVNARVIERMWMDRFEFLRSGMEDTNGDMVVFPLILHPDTSGMAHVIGMVERVLKWFKRWGGLVEFLTFEEIAGRGKKEKV